VRGPPPRHPDDQREPIPPVEGLITDAAELVPGARVVYPNQGVCTVVGQEEKDISGHTLQLVRMRREEDGAAVLVPRNKVSAIGLRLVATTGQLQGVFHYLAAQLSDPELDWKIRHRDNADRLIAGGVLGLAEVVKGLHSLSRLRPLPAKEREQYDNARHLLVHEVAVSLSVSPGLAEDYIDYALMPPAGVKFDVPPPPAPVALPSRPRHRRPVVEEEEGGDLGDLGLGDLGLELELEGAGEQGGEGAASEEATEGGEAAPKAEGSLPVEEPKREPEKPRTGPKPRTPKKAAPVKPKKAPKRSEKAREKPSRKVAHRSTTKRGRKKR